MNRKFNRVYVLSASLLASLVLLNLPFTVNASSLLQDESVSYIEYETDSVGELDLPEYDSVESAINDKSLMFATLEEKILCDFYDLLVL